METNIILFFTFAIIFLVFIVAIVKMINVREKNEKIYFGFTGYDIVDIKNLKFILSKVKVRKSRYISKILIYRNEECIGVHHISVSEFNREKDADNFLKKVEYILFPYTDNIIFID